MSMKVKKLSIKLDWVKSTKNCEVYGNAAQSAEVSTVYIKKSAFSGEAPTVIMMSIEEVEE